MCNALAIVNILSQHLVTRRFYEGKIDKNTKVQFAASYASVFLVFQISQFV